MVIRHDSQRFLPRPEHPRCFRMLRGHSNRRPISGLRAGSGWISTADHDWPFV